MVLNDTLRRDRLLCRPETGVKALIKPLSTDGPRVRIAVDYADDDRSPDVRRPHLHDDIEHAFQQIERELVEVLQRRIDDLPDGGRS